MSKIQETVWPAKQHTIAKIAILKAYLDAWFPILGHSKPGQPILYVDGFAGPGEYTNHPDGSPVVALASAGAAIEALDKRGQWRAGPVHCIFIEKDAKRCEKLRKRLSRVPTHPRVQIAVYQDSFVSGMTKIRAKLPDSFRRAHPLFVFIDPFGATGAPFDTVADILQSRCSEVLINLDADGIGRILLAEARADHARKLTSIFGDESWKTALLAQNDFPTLCRQVLDLYKSKLQSIPRVKYVFPFAMRDTTDSTHYYLVFASQEPLGLKKMKEAMRRIDRSGSYCFTDGGVGQHVLFRPDDPQVFAKQLHERFVGRVVLRDELCDIALLETPFTDPAPMLRELEQDAMIEVTSTNPKRRRGSFNEDTLVSVTFLPAKQAIVREVQQGLFDGYKVEN